MAIANRIARAIYCILKDEALQYKDLGSKHVIDEAKQIRNLIGKLKSYGVDVNLITNEKIEAIVTI